MKTHEYQAKQIFSSYGIPVEKHILCFTAEDAVKAYDGLDTETVVVKAQVLSGGRGKAGGVKLARNKEEVVFYADSILSMKIKELPVKKILISEAVQIDSEYYVGFTIDRNSKSVILMLSREGGVDIETVASETPEKIYRFTIEPFVGMPDYLAKKIAFTLFKESTQVNSMAKILKSLYQVFIEKDASLAEINPLVLTKENRLVAIDAKMTFDDNALYRQTEILAFFEPTEDEKIESSAKEKGFSFVKMDGDIGCMVNGAGLAMATMDMIKLYGGNPANFLDIGGSSNPDKVIEGMRLLLNDKRVKVVLINIFGGITRCDDVANGLLTAFQKIESDIPVIVRLTGTNEKKGRDLLRNTRFIVAETMGEATRLAVGSSKN